MDYRKFSAFECRKYGNAVQDDLWAALTAQAIVDNVSLPVDVKTIMDTWTLKMVFQYNTTVKYSFILYLIYHIYKGYPVINVERDYVTLAANVSQVLQCRYVIENPV